MRLSPPCGQQRSVFSFCLLFPLSARLSILKARLLFSSFVRAAAAPSQSVAFGRRALSCLISPAFFRTAGLALLLTRSHEKTGAFYYRTGCSHLFLSCLSLCSPFSFVFVFSPIDPDGAVSGGSYQLRPYAAAMDLVLPIVAPVF